MYYECTTSQSVSRIYPFFFLLFRLPHLLLLQQRRQKKKRGGGDVCKKVRVRVQIQRKKAHPFTPVSLNSIGMLFTSYLVSQN